MGLSESISKRMINHILHQLGDIVLTPESETVIGVTVANNLGEGMIVMSNMGKKFN